MKSAMSIQDSSAMSAKFLEQYSMEETICKYTRKTAGHGISYLLENEYGRIYLESIERYIPKSRLKTGIRLWEFGCGGGMNLLHLGGRSAGIDAMPLQREQLHHDIENIRLVFHDHDADGDACW